MHPRQSLKAVLAKLALAFRLGKPVHFSENRIMQRGDEAAKTAFFFSGLAAADDGNWAGARDRFKKADGMLGGFSIDGLSDQDLKTSFSKKEIPHIAMGVFYSLYKFPTQAERELAMALARQTDLLQPENGSIQDTLGWIFYHKKDYPSAV